MSWNICDKQSCCHGNLSGKEVCHISITASATEANLSQDELILKKSDLKVFRHFVLSSLCGSLSQLYLCISGWAAVSAPGLSAFQTKHTSISVSRAACDPCVLASS